MGGIARYSFSAAYAGDDCKAIWRCQQMIFLPRFFSVLAMLLLIVIAAPVALQKDMPYVAARKLLLKEGWLPVNLHLHDDYALMGVERELFKHNFKEFDSCSIDYSNCVMRYKRAKQCLTVYTVGEKIRNMKVVDWNSECPDGAPQSDSQPSEKDRTI